MVKVRSASFSRFSCNDTWQMDKLTHGHWILDAFGPVWKHQGKFFMQLAIYAACFHSLQFDHSIAGALLLCHSILSLILASDSQILGDHCNSSRLFSVMEPFLLFDMNKESYVLILA
jgi:hypothetical protein